MPPNGSQRHRAAGRGRHGGVGRAAFRRQRDGARRERDRGHVTGAGKGFLCIFSRFFLLCSIRRLSAVRGALVPARTLEPAFHEKLTDMLFSHEQEAETSEGGAEDDEDGRWTGYFACWMAPGQEIGEEGQEYVASEHRAAWEHIKSRGVRFHLN